MVFYKNCYLNRVSMQTALAFIHPDVLIPRDEIEVEIFHNPEMDFNMHLTFRFRCPRTQRFAYIFIDSTMLDIKYEDQQRYRTSLNVSNKDYARQEVLATMNEIFEEMLYN